MVNGLPVGPMLDSFGRHRKMRRYESVDPAKLAHVQALLGAFLDSITSDQGVEVKTASQDALTLAFLRVRSPKSTEAIWAIELVFSLSEVLPAMKSGKVEISDRGLRTMLDKYRSDNKEPWPPLMRTTLRQCGSEFVTTYFAIMPKA